MARTTFGWMALWMALTTGGATLAAGPGAGDVLDPGLAIAFDASAGQAIPVWVFFADKGFADSTARQAALAKVESEYSPRAIHRRTLRRSRPGLFDFDDLRVADRYVRAVTSTGVTIRTRSRWLNAVSVLADRPAIDRLAALPFVVRIKPLARTVRVEPRIERRVTGSAPGDDGGSGPADFYGYASDQLHQINIPAVHDLGFTGAGMIIGVLDTGFQRSHEAYNEAGHEITVLGEHDFVMDDENTQKEQGDHPWQHWHGTAILSTIGAYKPDTLVGGAYDASFYLAKTEDVTQEAPIEEDYYVAGLEWFEANGVDLATSSLGYIDWYTQDDLDGQTAVTTIGVNVATANGMACCTAAGNGGHDGDPNTSHLIAPSDAFEVLACGAVNSEGEAPGFSSDGPTADGRLKPEVMARGEATWTIDPDNDAGYLQVSGTSLSTPLVASATALVIQAHPDWSIPQIRTALMRNASWFKDTGTFDPLFVYGYGVIDVLAAIEMDFTGDVDRDGDTDLDDHATLVDCLTGPGVPPDTGCEDADLMQDGDVDLQDFAVIQNGFTGAR